MLAISSSEKSERDYRAKSQTVPKKTPQTCANAIGVLIHLLELKSHMEVKFMLPPAAQQGNKLNGTYSIHHTSCPASVCGGGHFLTGDTLLLT